MYDGVGVSSDGSMNAHTHAGQELGSFLSRQLRISQFTWEGDTVSITGIDPWSLMLNHPTVKEKINHFKLVKGCLNLRFTANGNPTLLGRLGVFYNVRPGKDDYLPENDAESLTRLSQRPNVQINPTISSGAVMKLPFFWEYNALHIPTQEWNQMGSLYILPISPLESASGTTPKVDISVFAWMTDVELSQPTSYSGMSSEKSQKIVSKTAMAVGDVADAMSNIPVIGPYATATGTVAKKLGRLADLFGFSKPIGTYDRMEERTRHAGSMATVNDKDSSIQLTLDAHQETTIDPRTVGLAPIDEMSIAYLVQKEAMIARCKWNINDQVGKTLMKIPVTPFIKGNLNTDGSIHLPPCAYVAGFFKYWRGTMKYRVQIHCSAFMRGKLRLKYEPWATSNADDYNVVSSDIVDLTTTTDYAMNIGWGSHRNNLKIHSSFPQHQEATPIATSFSDTTNGLLVLQVENPLTVPDDDGVTEVNIVISVAAHEDMQFHVPDCSVMETYALTNTQGTDVIPDPAPPPDGVFAQPVKQYSDTRIGAYYYGWHSGGFNGGTNGDNYLRKRLVNENGASVAHTPWVKPRPPEEYDDRQRDVTRKQFNLMTNAGIDFVVCSWWGKDSRTDVHFRDYVMTETGSVGGNHMRACIHYETLDLKRNGGWNWSTDVYNQLVEDAVRFGSYMSDPEKYLYKDGKPVIFLYLYRSMPSSFRNELCSWLSSTLNNTFGFVPYIAADVMFGNAQTLPTADADLIDAMTTYDVYGQTSKGRSVLEEEDVADYHAQINAWANANSHLDVITCVSPGYNDRGVRLGEDHVGLARYLNNWDHGSLLKAHLKHFNNETNPSGTHWIVINSWNEWQEDSQIEPVSGGLTTNLPTEITSGNTYESYGMKYVDIVGNYMVSGYVGQSSERCLYIGMSEEKVSNEENNKEMQVSSEMVEKPWTYSRDDAIFFGERTSLRAALKRYSCVYKLNCGSGGRNRLYLPLHPRSSSFTVNGLTTYDHLLNWVEVMYHAKRGGSRWKVFTDFKNSTARVAGPRLEDVSLLDLIENISSNDAFKLGWQGMDLVSGVYNPVSEWQVPSYTDKRFFDARKIGTDMNMRGHSYCFDTAACNKLYICAAAADDFQCFFFAGTPALRYR